MNHILRKSIGIVEQQHYFQVMKTGKIYHREIEIPVNISYNIQII